jgi:hypothetical protein
MGCLKFCIVAEPLKSGWRAFGQSDARKGMNLRMSLRHLGVESP